MIVISKEQNEIVKLLVADVLRNNTNEKRIADITKVGLHYGIDIDMLSNCCNGRCTYVCQNNKQRENAIYVKDVFVDLIDMVNEEDNNYNIAEDVEKIMESYRDAIVDFYNVLEDKENIS